MVCSLSLRERVGVRGNKYRILFLPIHLTLPLPFVKTVTSYRAYAQKMVGA